MDLTTRADREGKHADYANRYDRSDLKVANLKELNMQIDRGYRVRARPPPALPCMGARCSAGWWLSSAPAVLLHACRAGLTGWLAWLQVSDEQLKELAVRTETTNPWYWGIRTLAKVGPRAWAGCVSGGVRVSIWLYSRRRRRKRPAHMHGSQSSASAGLGGVLGADAAVAAAVARDARLPGPAVPGPAHRGQGGAGADHHDAVLEDWRQPRAEQLLQPDCRPVPVDHPAGLRGHRVHPHHRAGAPAVCAVRCRPSMCTCLAV